MLKVLSRDPKAVQDYSIFGTLPKQLLHVTHDVMCDHVIYRPFRILMHKNLWRSFENL